MKNTCTNFARQDISWTFICSLLENYFFILVGFFQEFDPVVFTDKNETFVHKMFSIIDFSLSQDTELSTGSIQKFRAPVFDKVLSPDTS